MVERETSFSLSFRSSCPSYFSASSPTISIAYWVPTTVFVVSTTVMLDVMSAGMTGNETSTDLLNDRISLIAATTLVGVFYGIMATLYCITIYFLLRKLLRRPLRSGSHPDLLLRSRAEWRKTLFYIAYTSTLFVLATLYAAGNSQNAIVAYVNNRLYPAGPYNYYVTYMACQSVMVMTDIASSMILWMTDALILCRFVVFYYHIPYARWIIIPLACAMYVGVVALSILVLQGEAGLGKIFYLSENMILVYYVLSFSLNVLATVLISARLYWHKIQLERVFGSKTNSPYMSIATMLIESAFIYGTWSLVFLILCVRKSPGQTIILATMSQVQVIAPLLIILWIARGRAWNASKSFEESEDEPPIEFPASLRFNAHSIGTVCPVNDTDAVRPSFSRNASWRTVVGVRATTHIDVNVIELGVSDSQPSSAVDDTKVPDMTT